RSIVGDPAHPGFQTRPCGTPSHGAVAEPVVHSNSRGRVIPNGAVSGQPAVDRLPAPLDLHPSPGVLDGSVGGIDALLGRSCPGNSGQLMPPNLPLLGVNGCHT